MNGSETNPTPNLKPAIGGVAAAVMSFPFVQTSHAAPDDPIKVGVIGCGGRGTGAVLDILGAVTKVIYPQSGYHTEDVDARASVLRKDVQVVALADLFDDRLGRCLEQLNKLGINIPKEQCFSGFDAYQKLLKIADINYVILATPPHFRPIHLKAAIEAGKNVFMEKPAAVDVTGVKMVLEAGELARQKGLGIAAGTQRRHMTSYRELIKGIHDGALGEILYARCYWNGGEIWVIEREPGWSDIEWQLRNWNYFTWLSGDHIVEQHVHNLDIMNWALGTHPIRAASGIGGRQVRTKEVHGHIFDHFAVEYEYPNGVFMFSQCRQINGCDNKVEEVVVGAKATAMMTNRGNAIMPKSGNVLRFKETPGSAYQKEHQNLIASIRAGQPINEAKTIAESTMTGIIGREAVYSGKAVVWDEAMKSTTKLGPEKYEFGSFPIPPIAIPGKHKML
jgi:predicted dehydrogenase